MRLLVVFLLLPMSLVGCIGGDTEVPTLVPPVDPDTSWSVGVGDDVISFPARDSQGSSGNNIGIASVASDDWLLVGFNDPFQAGTIHISTRNATVNATHSFQGGSNVEFMAGDGHKSRLLLAYRDGFANAQAAVFDAENASLSIHAVESSSDPDAIISKLNVLSLGPGRAIIAVGWFGYVTGAAYHLYLVEYSAESLDVRESLRLQMDVPFIPMGGLSKCGDSVCLMWTSAPTEVTLTRLTPDLDVQESRTAWSGSGGSRLILDVELEEDYQGNLWSTIGVQEPQNLVNDQMDEEGEPSIYVSPDGSEWHSIDHIAVDRFQLAPAQTGAILAYAGANDYEALHLTEGGEELISLDNDPVQLIRLQDAAAIAHSHRDNGTARLVIHAVT